jgi:hypothetical protein
MIIILWVGFFGVFYGIGRIFRGSEIFESNTPIPADNTDWCDPKTGCW